MRSKLLIAVPEGFEVSNPSTWPRLPGRLEFVAGRLELSPPHDDVQQRVAVDVVTELNMWRRTHPEFVVGANEAGMLLDGEVRGADVAIWRASSGAQAGFARTAPVLAVEIVGADDEVDVLLSKADWYLAHGVAIVWIVDAATRSVHVLTTDQRRITRDRIGESELLPGLAPLVADFFRQL